MSNIKVTVGDKAFSFHDQYTGVTVTKGEVVELNANQASSKRILQAINSGHLVRVENTVSSKKEDEKRIENLKLKLTNLYNDGKTVDKIAGAFTQDELRTLASSYGLEIEEKDTKMDITSAIIDAIDNE